MYNHSQIAPPCESISPEQLLLVAEPPSMSAAAEADDCGGGGLVTWTEEGLGSQPEPEPEV